MTLRQVDFRFGPVVQETPYPNRGDTAREAWGLVKKNERKLANVDDRRAPVAGAAATFEARRRATLDLKNWSYGRPLVPAQAQWLVPPTWVFLERRRYGLPIGSTGATLWLPNLS